MPTTPGVHGTSISVQPFPFLDNDAEDFAFMDIIIRKTLTALVLSVTQIRVYEIKDKGGLN